ncbi:hypothetical protein O181_034833 [Austropuccinia psidii MF-1]|uniref:Retroviral polymerase SH3-like domain-containing protein n=1 Tax=Austropuccinia psidii MF-1 TaxID=1389203 RepID=A0A9Q3D6A7_9BASI|nr:hypothetical protein [Austropuccinia psidii MF-1]
MKTLYGKVYKEEPKYINLHPFGCKVYINIKKQKMKSKISSRVQEGVFLGYVEGQNNFKVFNIETGKLQITNDCIFLDKKMSSLEEADFPSLNYPNSSISSVCVPAPVVSSIPFSIPCFPMADCSADSSSGTSLFIQEEEQPSVSENVVYVPNTESSLHLDPSELPSAEANISDNFLSLDLGEEPVEEEANKNKVLLPKGWVMETVPDKAPNNISRSIETENIVTGKRERKKPIYLVAMGSNIPKTYKNTVNHAKASQ